MSEIFQFLSLSLYRKSPRVATINGKNANIGSVRFDNDKPKILNLVLHNHAGIMSHGLMVCGVEVLK